ncbi:MAG: S1 RNA-binding domain-containing protein [Candidatus Latescibacteria bacterium]|nr:S1 RNA-binding domain-containing protein [Candidatus Latescibacterota bacterium]MBT5832687.1 S1 RNA-binding domain-containing protein [Candidatus Latescibacterota bacterium]
MNESNESPSMEELDKQYTDDGPSKEFADLLAESEEKDNHKEVSVGEKVTGTLQSVGDAVAFVDYGGRSEASIEVLELKDEDGELKYNSGDPIEAYVANTEGEVKLTLSLRVSSPEMLQQAKEKGIPVEGKVTGFNPGGLVVNLGGARAFCPMSQIDMGFVDDPASYAGRTLTFKIMELRGRDNVVVSHRAYLVEENSKLADELRKELAVDQEIVGKVTRLERFGAFVDLGGVEGLVHVSEISYTRVDSPGDVLQKGQELRVKILELKDLGGKEERISLSLKAMEPDPWDKAVEEFREGEIVKGKVVSTPNFGAFVELAPGIEGLIHISQLSSGKRISNPTEVVSVGQEVQARVQEINRRQKRISLSMRAVEEAAEQSAAAEDMAAFKTQQETQAPSGADNAMAEALRRAGLN